MPLGASILDLLPIPPGTQSAIPSGLRSFLERFAAVDLTSSTTTGATFHYGTLLPMLEDTGIEDAVRGWSIEGAGFDRGVRFQLAATRGPTVDNIEPQPAQFQIDLFLEQVSIVVPALKGARLIPRAGSRSIRRWRWRCSTRPICSGAARLSAHSVCSSLPIDSACSTRRFRC
jgi:hypothetical protein